MRISNATMADNIKGYLSTQTEQMLKSQEQIASGKRINRPSDDPIGMGESLGYQKTISKIDQYDTNISDAQLQINSLDEILSSITDMLSQAKDIAANPDPSMNGMLADQVGTIRDQVLQMANSRVNGSYVFSGDLTDKQPFDDTGTYQGDSGTKDYIIGDNMQVNIKADGSQVFVQNGQNVFTVLSDLQDALNNNDSAAIANQFQSLNTLIGGLDTVRGVNAGQAQRLQATQNYNAGFKVNVQDMLSQTEDTDMASAIIDFQVQQAAYQSTLATAAKIIQPSLLDFLQ
jgi:flagellar hook-associated protein 3 FlgL